MPAENEPEIQISDKRIQTICLMVLAGVAGVYLVFWLRPVLVPFVVACFIVSGVGPVLTYLEKRFNVSRLIAAVISFLLGVALMGIFGLTIWVSIIDLSTNAGAYRNRVRELVAKVEASLPMDLISASPLALPRAATKSSGKDESPSDRDTSDNQNESSDESSGKAEPSGDSDEPSDSREASESRDEQGNSDELRDRDDNALGIPEDVIAGGSTVAEQAHNRKMREATKLIDTFVRDGISVVSGAFVSLVSTSIVVLIYVFFLLLGKPAFSHTGTGREIDTQIRQYLSLKTVISIITGLAFGLTLRLFGVPMALSFGVLAFLLNFIPNIGPIVASLLPIPLILLDPSGNIVWMIAVIATTSSIQLISGNVVEPKLMGNSSDLHPVTILLGLMFWGMMWGIIGMFLATPITAAIKIVLERFEPTRQIANLMAGRWDGLDTEEPNTTKTVETS